MTNDYDYVDNTSSDVQALVHVINLQGKDLIGAEIGVLQGSSTMTLLHNCPNIKTLYAVDAFVPYTDFLYNYAINEISDRDIDRAS